MVQRPTPSRPSPHEGRQHEIDRHVGHRIRLRRMLLGMTQSQLATMVGVSFQQLHFYERGQSGVPASRLYDLAGALAVPVDFFFAGLEADGDGRAPGGAPAPSADRAPSGDWHEDGRSQRDVRAMIQHFRRIRDPAVRRELLDWVERLASDPDAERPEPGRGR